WRYEDSIQRKGYKIKNIQIVNQQIEHISPKAPTNGEAMATGYEVDENNCYDDDFLNKYLNCLGNFLLISGSHNASIGNKPFSDKLETYIHNPLLKQQAEIVSFFTGTKANPKWGKEAISKRQQAILNF